jgi:hypothetical protein
MTEKRLLSKESNKDYSSFLQKKRLAVQRFHIFLGKTIVFQNNMAKDQPNRRLQR